MASRIARRRRVLIGTVVAAAAIVPITIAAPPAAAATHPPAAPAAVRAAGPAPVTEAVATAQAAISGRPVTVTSLTSPTQLAVANPDGTVTMTFTADPVRTQTVTGAWVPIDTTLSVAHGSVVPAAVTVPMAFSAGGSSTPLATMTRDGTTYRLYSPWPLPAPVLSGDTATYRSVRPGVDIVVVAMADGFSDNVVIESRAAAADPALAAISFPVVDTGLRQAADPATGIVRQLNAQGRPEFVGDAPTMWDTRSVAPAPTTAAPTTAVVRAAVTAAPRGARAIPLATSVTAAAVVLRPDPAMLASPSTVFPVVLDPVTKTYSINGWIVLDRQHASTSYWKDSPDPQGSLSVGYDGFSTGSVRRSVVQFGTSALGGKVILSATYTPYEIWSSSCNKREVDAYRTGSINSSQNWNKQPSWASKVDSATVAHGWTGSGSTCAASSPVEFDVTAAVSYTAGQSSSSTALGLRAASETDDLGWKQFATPSGTHKPTLSVRYLSKPSVPTSVKMATPDLSCSTSSSSPTFININNPRLQAKVNDADGSDATLKANFRVFNGTTQTWSASSSGTVASGAIVFATTSALANSVLYYYQARTEYDYTAGGTAKTSDSGWSSPCYFKVDTNAPAAPSVSSAVYAQCASPDDPDTCVADGGVGQGATFTFTGVADVKTFTYTLNSALQKSVTATASGTGTTASVTIVPNLRDVNILQVEAKDAAANVSETAEYDFKVLPGSSPVGVWTLDDGSGTTLADSNTRGTLHPATLTGGYNWVGSGRLGGSTNFDGTTGYAFTSGPVVDTSKSLAVSAWVRLSTLAQNSEFVSQDGVVQNGFELYYSTTYGWVFNKLSMDATGEQVIRALNPAVAQPLVWTHLVGVYDSVAQTITLYVNGVPGTPVAFTTPWNATGKLQIGRHLTNNQYINYTAGQIDQVEIWDRVLSPQEISDDDQVIDPGTGLSTPTVQRDWEAAETTGTTAADTSGYGHNLTLSAGASFTTDPDRAQVLTLNGSSGYATEAGPSVDATGSFTATAWVNLDDTNLGTGARTATVFSMGGTSQASWGLWYAQAASLPGFWYFGRTAANAASTTTTTIVSDDPAETDGWVMLSVVYDAPDQTMNLYVNGVRQGDGVSFDGTPWQATGTFAVGRGLVNGAWGGYFPGSVDEMTVSAGVTSESALLTQWATELM